MEEKGKIEGMYKYKSRIKEILEKRGISQKELAEKVNITESAMSRYVNGSRIPRGEYLIEMAKVLKVKVEELYEQKL